MKKIAKLFILATTLTSVSSLLASCSNTDKAMDVQNNLQTVLKEHSSEDGTKITNFKLMGVDIDKSGFDFDVVFNGVSTLNDTKNLAFASVSYVVDSTEFLNIGKRSSMDSVYEVFNNVIANNQNFVISYAPVSSLTSVNDTFIKNCPSPFSGYNLTNGFVYNLSQPTFDDNSQSISFKVKSLIDLKKKSIKMGWGLGIGFSGGFGLGVGPFVTVKEGEFTTSDIYTLNLTPEKYAEMKNDNKLIYDYCVNAIKDKDSSKIGVERTQVVDVAYDNADLLDYFNIGKTQDDIVRDM